MNVPFAGQPVDVVGVYRPSEAGDLVDDFREQTGITFPLVADGDDTLSLLAFPPGVGSPYPRDVVVGKDLRIRSIRNSFELDELTFLIEELLAE